MDPQPPSSTVAAHSHAPAWRFQARDVGHSQLMGTEPGAEGLIRAESSVAPGSEAAMHACS